jgi:hypothetical protein
LAAEARSIVWPEEASGMANKKNRVNKVKNLAVSREETFIIYLYFFQYREVADE